MMKKGGMKYSEEKSFEERQQESQNILKKFPENVPIIVEKHANSKLPNLSQRKFLLQKNLRVYHLTLLIRKKMSLTKADALYLFINGKDLLKSDTQIQEAYDKNKDKDGFLYVTFAELPSFGNNNKDF